MSDHASPTSTELQVISFEAVPGEGPERQEALAAREAFMSWRPTCASSWRTPSESSSSSEEHHSDDGSPTLRRSLAVPQLLIPTQERYQSLHAGGTPGQPLLPLIPRDNEVDDPRPCKPPYCPIPDSPTSSDQSDCLRPLEEGGSPCKCLDRFVPPTPPLSPMLPPITAFKSETPSTPSARAYSEGTSGMPLKTSPSPAATPLLLRRFSPSSKKRISSSMPCLVTLTMPRPRSPSPSHRELRPNTVWGHYLRTVGGHLPDPLYHHPSPRKRTTKKPLCYRLTPAERRDLDKLALEALPRPGRMLTRQLLGKIMDGSRFPSDST